MHSGMDACQATPRCSEITKETPGISFDAVGKQVGEDMHQYLQHRIYSIPIDRVKAAFSSFGLLHKRVHFVKGFFENTVPAFGFPPNPVALLRLDGDLWTSTMVVLDHFYPAVAAGGYVVVDDYDWFEDRNSTCRAAVTAYRKKMNVTAPITREMLFRHGESFPIFIRVSLRP